MKNARAKRAKLQFFIVKYANLWRCYRRRRCDRLSNLIGHFRVHYQPLFQRISAKSLLWRSVFNYIGIRTSYHNTNFALRLALKERLMGLGNGLYCFLTSCWGLNPLAAEWALMALIDFTLSNARRFYSSMGNPFGRERVKGVKVKRYCGV